MEILNGVPQEGSGSTVAETYLGDVVGPGSSTDNAVARFDQATGKLIQNSSVTINDDGAVNIPAGQTYKINNVAHTHPYGDVTGPGSSTDNSIVRFDLTTGKLIQGSSVTLSDSGLLAGVYVELKEVTKASTATLAQEELKNTVINNYNQAAAMTLTLPAAASGMSFLFTVCTTGYAIHIKAGSGDKFYFDGVTLDDGDKISNSSPALGDYVSILSFRTGAATYDWIVQTGVGTWSDGGA